MSQWQTKVERSHRVVRNSKGLGKNDQNYDSKVVWKDSKELGMARAKSPDGRSTYVVGRYSPAGNMMGRFEENVFPSNSKDIKTSFPKSNQPTEHAQKTRVVERSTTGGAVRTVVKETRTQTPQGVKTVKTTTTWSSNDNNPSQKRFDETKWEEPQTKFKSLNITGGNDKPKVSTITTKPSTTGKSSPVPTAGSFKDQTLKLHNHYRRIHQVPDVTWSNELARGAQAWADKIARMNTLQHAPANERNKDGENIAYFGGKRDNNIAKETVDMWYDEEKKYNYKRPNFQSGTGHFTQVVWKGTKEIAVAYAQSSDGRNTYVVGRYRPAGNMMRDFEANVFPKKR